MILSLGQTKDVTVQASETESVSEVIILKIEDNPSAKTITAYVSANDRAVKLVLWSGYNYDSIGDWTQKQAEDKILDVI